MQVRWPVLPASSQPQAGPAPAPPSCKPYPNRETLPLPRLCSQYRSCAPGPALRPAPLDPPPAPPAPRPTRRGCAGLLGPPGSGLLPTRLGIPRPSQWQPLSAALGPPVRAPGDGPAWPGRRAPCRPPPGPRQARRSCAGCRPTPRARASTARAALRVRSLAPCVSAAIRCRAPGRSPADWAAAESAPCRGRHPAREARRHLPSHLSQPVTFMKYRN